MLSLIATKLKLNKKLILIIFNMAVFAALLYIVRIVLYGIQPELALFFIFGLIFMYAAYDDLVSGEIHIIRFVFFLFVWEIYLSNWVIFISVFVLMLICYAISNHLLKQTPFGFGDVLAIPLAITALFYLGAVPMATGVIAISAAFIYRISMGYKELRLLPVLFLGIFVAFITALVLALI